MPNAYVELLRTPGGPAFSAAAFVARLPISMYGIGIVLLVEGETGRYGVAGGVAATFILAAAFGQPLLSRRIDRLGQARAAFPLLAVHIVAMAVMVWAASADQQAALIAAAAVTGASLPNFGALVRARWSLIYGGRPMLRTAFSFESVVDEAVFVIGPPLVTILAVVIGVGPALLSTVVLVAVGGTAFLLQRGTEPPPAPAGRLEGRGALRNPGMPLLMLVMACLGGVFGSVEVTAVAFADGQGSAGEAGLILASYAFASMVAGITYGARHPTAPLDRQLRIGLAAMAVTLLALPFAPTTPWLIGAVLLAGATIAPTLIVGFSLVERLVPDARLTEGLTLISTALSLGVSVGALAAGQVIDGAGASSAFWVATVSGGLAAAIVLTWGRTLRAHAEGAAP